MWGRWKRRKQEARAQGADPAGSASDTPTTDVHADAAESEAAQLAEIAGRYSVLGPRELQALAAGIWPRPDPTGQAHILSERDRLRAEGRAVGVERGWEDWPQRDRELYLAGALDRDRRPTARFLEILYGPINVPTPGGPLAEIADARAERAERVPFQMPPPEPPMIIIDLGRDRTTRPPRA